MADEPIVEPADGVLPPVYRPFTEADAAIYGRNLLAMQPTVSAPVMPRLVSKGVDHLKSVVESDVSIPEGDDGQRALEALYAWLNGNYADPPPLPDPPPVPPPPPDPLAGWRETFNELSKTLTPDELPILVATGQKAIADAQKPPPPEPTADEAMDAALKALAVAGERKKREFAATMDAEMAANKKKLTEITSATKNPDVFVKLDDLEKHGMALIQDHIDHELPSWGFSSDEHVAVQAAKAVILKIFGAHAKP